MNTITQQQNLCRCGCGTALTDPRKKRRAERSSVKTYKITLPDSSVISITNLGKWVQANIHLFVDKNPTRKWVFWRAVVSCLQNYGSYQTVKCQFAENSANLSGWEIIPPDKPAFRVNTGVYRWLRKNWDQLKLDDDDVWSSARTETIVATGKYNGWKLALLKPTGEYHRCANCDVVLYGRGNKNRTKYIQPPHCSQRCKSNDILWRKSHQIDKYNKSNPTAVEFAIVDPKGKIHSGKNVSAWVHENIGLFYDDHPESKMSFERRVIYGILATVSNSKPGYKGWTKVSEVEKKEGDDLLKRKELHLVPT